ncbi:hypothetical protein ERX46_10865 [Brumimicrobium glaciale]|uniref:DUF5683 domain-containing protein n=1 Tax=Brumimicrobium glaciale TaxID=200475 RepID=A0A4Q4KM34_9FLAO|nr:DUF5683 domain-containing protein [Brumimicrobium glaciale]RYM33434.1 hypothetical protein ERX46_10865 [Brumimicrobium glaciale]
MRFLLVLLLFITVAIKAQEPKQLDSLAIDSTLMSKVKVKDTVHSPKKAALLSLIPGGGQIYNHIAMPKGKKKAFWKIPIIYAGLGYTGFKAVQNHITQRDLKAEYLYRDEFETPNLDKYTQYDDQGVLTLFEDFRRKRDLMIFAFIAVYGLNILDAHVEAHFVNFDVSKDLSLSIKPTMHDFRTPGLALSLNFR